MRQRWPGRLSCGVPEHYGGPGNSLVNIREVFRNFKMNLFLNEGILIISDYNFKSGILCAFFQRPGGSFMMMLGKLAKRRS